MKTYNIFDNELKNLGQFTDNRGSILDIFVDQPVDHSCWILSVAGAIRGNHYHKYTTQYTLVLSGELYYVSRNLIDNTLVEGVFEKGTMIVSPPMEAHAMQARDGSCEFIAFASGPRGGHNYENDTFRLNEHEKLILP